MQAERDHLQNIVFPELAERLRARRHHLEPIDLRWGVQTVSVDDEHRKELLVLTVCLDEVERSRPFFIGLLGDRYGWVPPEGRLRSAARERGFDQDLAGKSVTALEIEFGVLASPQQKRQCFFYLRDPLPYDRMDAETAALFSDSHCKEAGAAQRVKDLARLKERLEQELPGRIRHYAADWSDAQQKVTGLEDFGKRVLEDLWTELEEQTRDFATPEQASEPRQERRALEDFIEDRKQGFVGRGELLGELEAFVLSSSPVSGGWGLCLTGPDGCGKSSVFAQLCLRLQGSDAVVLAHSAGTSPRSSSVDALLGRWNDELASQLGLKGPVFNATSREKIEALFAFLLAEAAKKKRVILLIDAVDRFEGTARARYLSWLPEPVPSNVRLIATMIAGDESKALTGRDGVVPREMPPLEQWEAEAIVHHVCQRYHRQPARDLLTTLLRREAGGKPCWKDVSWLRLAAQRLNLLDADDYARAEKEFKGGGEAGLHALLLDLAARLPADTAGMYDWMLERSGKLFGESWAKTVALLIALSRNGWRESDLRALLPALAGETWDALRFAGLRRSFLGHLPQHGDLGQWVFLDQALRRAVLRRYAPRHEEEVRIHQAVVACLRTLPGEDAVRRNETMYHLLAAGDALGAASYYASSLGDAERVAATWTLVEFLARAEADGDEKATQWIVTLPESEGLGDDQRRALAVQCFSHLRGALQRSGVHEMTRMTLMRVATGVLKRLDKDGSAWEEVGGKLAETGRLLKPGAQSSKADLAAQKSLGVPGAKSFNIADRAREAAERLRKILAAQPDRYQAEKEACREKLKKAERLAQENRNEDALREYGECRSEALALVEHDGDDPAPYDWFYLCCVGLARLHVLAKDVDSAIEDLRVEAELARRAGGKFPKEPGWLLRASDGHRRAASLLLMHKRDCAACAEENRKSIAAIEELGRLHPDHPDWRTELAEGHSMLAEVLADTADKAGAVNEYIQAIKMLRALAGGDACSPKLRYKLFLGYLALGNLLAGQGDVGGAADSFMSALPQAKWLVDREPDNPKWHFEHALGHYSIGGLYVMRRIPAGLPHLQYARVILRRFEQRGLTLDPQHKRLAQTIEQILSRTGVKDEVLETMLQKSGLENIEYKY